MAAVQDIYQVRVFVAFGGQGAINVLHWRCGTIAGTGATDAQIANAFDLALGLPYKTLMTSSCSYRGVGVRRIFPGQSIETYGTAGVGPGSVTGDPLPKQIAGLISLRTINPGVHMRGRVYIPFPGESSNDADSTPTLPYINNLNALAGVFISIITAGTPPNQNTFLMGVFHRGSSLITDIWQTRVNDKWATQRRRGDYGRVNALPI